MEKTLRSLLSFLLDAASRLFSRRLIFSLAAVPVLGAKFLHIYAHVDALQLRTALSWGSSFFLQDTILLLLLRLLTGRGAFARCTASLVAVILLLMGSGTVAFYIATGTELRWKSMNAIHDPSAFRMLRTGIFMLLVVLAAIIFLAIVLQSLCSFVADMCIDVLWAPLDFNLNNFTDWKGKQEYIVGNASCLLLPKDQDQVEESDSDLESLPLTPGSDLVSSRNLSSMLFLRLLVAFAMALQVICTVMRPQDSSLIFLSWTLPLMPVVHLWIGAALSSSTELAPGFQNQTALRKPVSLSWLPEEPQSGFEDWYYDRPHYNPEYDPLRLANYEQELLPDLHRIELGNVSIKHVMVVMLESTRKDVFPLKKGSGVWNRLASTFKNGDIPSHIEEQLEALTPMARYLTRDFKDDIQNATHSSQNGYRAFRGGLSAQNAHTTSTYTLKSLLGTHCGVVPLAADLNREFTEHIYQPCLPQIFDAFNHLECSMNEINQKAGKWISKFMQSTTLGYDHQDLLMPKLGFARENIIGGEQLREEGHKFPPSNYSDVNYYGMPEVAIEDYLRDAFAHAKAHDERLFLSHLTSTSHHNFNLPDDEKQVNLAGHRDWKWLSRYVNTIGYVDRWLGKVLSILEEEGVADETLIVLAGDHGLSIAEDNSFTPYHNPKVSNFHVPLIFSHPNLPRINIKDPVTLLQVLPTVLDLLIETKTFTPCEASAARDLLRNYEGQSLLRPQQYTSPDNDDVGWQFTIMNPGGASLAVRDANKPNLRLIVPLQAGSEWRFTDLTDNADEKRAVLSFDLSTLLRRLDDPSHKDWVRRAVQVAEWWVKENHKRYRFKV